MKFQWLQLLMICNLFFITPTIAQQVFEDIVYEPVSIEYEGVHSPVIQDYADRAFVAIKNYHSKTAQELFDSILIIDKHNLLGLYGLAACKHADGDYEAAIEALTPLINVNPKNAGLFSLRARCFMVLDNMPKALEDFKIAVELTADEKDILSLSECLFYTGDYAASILEADKFSLKQNKKPDGFFVKGLAKSELKDFLGANEELKKAIDIDPENSTAYFQMARNFLLLKETNKAMKQINKALELDTKNAQALDLRAELKYLNHDYSNAIIDCNRVIQLDDETKYAYLTRGKSYNKMGLKKDACADFKKALELGNSDATEQLTKYCK